MKFSSVQIQHFGHFVNFELPMGDSPFVLIHGHNEAGKTTLLQFLRQLLFGFPERTPYSFGDGGEIAGSAKLVLADQRQVELRRRKGRKNTVQARVQGQAQELDDAGFRQLLGNANENVFKTVFAFGLDELREGNEGLKDESLQSALFGGGLGGGRNPELLLESLDADANQLYKPSASKPPINAISAELKRLAAEIKQRAVRPDDYERRHSAWKQAQQQAELLSTELQELRRRQATQERLLNALPRWLELQLLETRRRELILKVILPSDAESNFSNLLTNIDRLARESAKVERELADAQRQLDALQLDRTLLPLRGEIEACHQLIHSVVEARRDLPLKKADAARQREELLATLQRLRPGWTLDELQLSVIDVALRHDFDQLADRRRELDKAIAALRAKFDQNQQSLVLCQAELGTEDAVTQVNSLTDVLAGGDDFAAELKTLRKETDAHSRVLRQLETQRARLSPPLPVQPVLDVASLLKLPVPPREWIGQQSQELQQWKQRRQMAEGVVAEAAKACDQLRRELESLSHAQQTVPTLDELREHRTVRDEAWQKLKRRYIEADTSAANVPTPESYEQTVRAADHTADRIYRDAHEVTRREDLRRRLAEAEATHTQRVAELAEVKQGELEFLEQWNAAWRPSGIVPFAPDLMLSWFDDFAMCGTLWETACQHESEALACRQRIELFQAKLLELLPETAGLEGTVLLAAARRVEQESRERQQQQKQRERELRRLEKQATELTSQLKAIADDEATWQDEWTRLLTRLNLPTTWQAEFARSVLSELANARDRLTSLHDLERRIALMEERISEFEPRVEKLGEQLKIANEEVAEVFVQRLHERLAEASKIQERRHQLETAITENQKVLRDLQAELADQRAARDQLLSRLEIASDDEYRALCQRSRQAEQLDTKRQELEGQLAVLRGQLSAEEFAATLGDADEIRLREELDRLQREISEKQEAEKAAREQAGSLRRDFERLDGGDEAAQLQQQMARQQAELVDLVHRFVPLVFAKHLLSGAIRRFERDNQPELIRLVSQLLKTMTDGRYVDIERPSSDRSALYVRRHDGHELAPDQLSTGTREQLYLAIRLGYVLQYCRQNEPLPIVMDDVLVNFDAPRARATLSALRDVTKHAQVLFFTCHQHVVDWVTKEFPETEPFNLNGVAR